MKSIEGRSRVSNMGDDLKRLGAGYQTSPQTEAILSRGRRMRLRWRIGVSFLSLLASTLVVAGGVAIWPTLSSVDSASNREVTQDPVVIPPPVGRDKVFMMDWNNGHGRARVIQVVPGSGAMRITLETGSTPMAVPSRDSRRLYTTFFDADSKSILQVIDLESGSTADREVLPDSLPGYMGGTYMPTMALTPDDSLLSVQLAHFVEEGSPFEVQLATYDVAAGALLQRTATIPDCGSGASQFGIGTRRFVVLCPESRRLVEVTIASDGSAASMRTVEIPTTDDSRTDENGNPLGLGAPAAGTITADGSTGYVVTQNGFVVVVDLATMTVDRTSDLNLSSGEYVTLSQPVITPDGGKLLLGIGGFDEFDRVRSGAMLFVDTESLSVESRLTGIRFSSIAMSPRGDFAYASDVGTADLLVVDVSSRSLARRIRSAAVSPTFVQVGTDPQ